MDPIPVKSRLLAQGWPDQKVCERHLAYAEKLNANLTFRHLQFQDREEVAELVRSAVAGLPDDWHVGSESGGVVALDERGDLIGALVLAAVDHGGVPYVYVHAVACVPEWRGRGVGVVLMGVLQQALPEDLLGGVVLYGQCAPDDARFFQKAGYTVLQPGEPIFIGRQLVSVPEGSAQRCWFSKEALLTQTS